MSSGHSVPFYCPYCGDEDLVPEVPEAASGGGHGHWSCRACRRGFQLKLTAIAVAPAPAAHRTTDSGTPAQN